MFGNKTMTNSTGNQYPQMLLYQPFAEYAAYPINGGLHNQQHHLQYDRHAMYMSNCISNSINHQVQYINRAPMFNSQHLGISPKHQGGFIAASHNPTMSLAGCIATHGASIPTTATCINPASDSSTSMNPASDSSRYMPIPSTSQCIDFPILITKQNKLSNDNDDGRIEHMQDAEIGSTCKDFLNQSTDKLNQKLHQNTSQNNALAVPTVRMIRESSAEENASVLHKMMMKQHCKQEDGSLVKQKSTKNRKGAAASASSPKNHLLLSAMNTSSKDRHTKVATARGLRDRRVRLSPACALQLFDIQDKLGFDQPSKAVDWLLKKAKFAIDRLQLNCNQASHGHGDNDYDDEHQEDLINIKQTISTQICVSPTESSTEDASETTTHHSDAAEHGQLDLRISPTSDHLESSVSLSLATNEDNHNHHHHHDQQKQDMLCSHKHVLLDSKKPKSQKKKIINSNHNENSHSDNALFSLVL